ncbi:hypothetical protein M23134_05704 [Microscilla marina ATCC 23134]|uniref:Uncharacterized protein n=1 Tax=Microscilla marina ATCC 23134 TaxID=313606 RepID=A1ZIG3_MICM2|nr:hypothetical protein M23134_05704 [Microscilla marina ATCC 23134]
MVIQVANTAKISTDSLRKQHLTPSNLNPPKNSYPKPPGHC